jgi:hypothetical protein
MAVDIVEEVAPGSSAAIQRGEMYVTAGQQRALYDVARARLGDERIKQSMETGRQKARDDLPPVLRPGNGTTRGEAAAHDFGTQLRALPDGPDDAAKVTRNYSRPDEAQQDTQMKDDLDRLIDKRLQP